MAGVPIVVDACSSLNLFATGRIVEIAEAANLHLLVLPEVEAEAQYLFGARDDEGIRSHETVDWKMLLGSGVAKSEVLSEDALPALISFASQLTDVDAKCVALAIHLNVGLLSDDGKVRRVFSSSGGIALQSTVSVVRTASEVMALDKPRVRAIFDRIRERARFEPPRKDPDYSWYLAVTTSK